LPSLTVPAAGVSAFLCGAAQCHGCSALSGTPGLAPEDVMNVRQNGMFLLFLSVVIYNGCVLYQAI